MLEQVAGFRLEYPAGFVGIRSLPAVCIETRRAKAAMGAMPNKTDLCGRPCGVNW